MTGTQRPLHQAMADLAQLAEDALLKPALPLVQLETRQDRIVAEMVAICTAMPSRTPLVSGAKVMSLLLRRLFWARRLGNAADSQLAACGVGFFIPQLQADVFAALAWERENTKPEREFT